ncbi:MAG: efflux RND transporter periplasmic adaptor subunit [Bacteroidetes bacterium]|nr:efflux RND transporter periplasmic adaptor subunit [Bacteroidota bacterium]
MELIPAQQNASEVDNDAIVMSEEAVKLAQVQTFIVSKKQPEKEIRLYGKIQADERTEQSILAHFSGRIETLLVNFTGEKINQGQLIAKIYSPELINAQQELFEAVKMKDVQPRLLDAARAKLSQMKLTNKQIEEIERSGKIKSVFDVYATVSGVVLAKRVSTGDYVQTGSSLFEVADLNHVWALFDAYESDLPWLKIGAPISYSILALPGKEFKGNIAFIDLVINPVTRIAKVRVEVNNTAGNLKPEMLASGIVRSILATTGNSIVIPESAVLWTGTRSIVYLKVPNASEPTFILREVTLGNYLQNSYEILDGLAEGEEIVTNGAFSIDAAAQLTGKKSMMNREEKDAQNKYQQGHNDASDTSKMALQKKGVDPSQSVASMEQASIKVSGNCEMCKARIETAVKKLPGVQSADWNVDSKMLQIAFDESQCNLATIQKAIATAGHDNLKQKATNEAYNNLPD